MNRNRFLLLITVAILGVSMFYFLTRTTLEEGMGGPATRASPTPRVGLTTGSSVTPTPSVSPLDDVRRKAGLGRLDLALAALNGVTNPSEARKILAGLRAYLASLPPEFASAVITDFLSDATRDAATQIGFSVGKKGFLDGHPSLRIALLDWLGQIQPAQAGAVAARILAAPTHPDEWAVCLRNYARAYSDPESREFLRAKTEELIRNPAWRDNPSVGFLEAFD